MVEVVAALAVAISEAAAISPGLPDIALRGTVSPATASQGTKERTLHGTGITSGTEIISDTTVIISDTTGISFLEIPFSMITHTGITIRTMAIMTTMPATIPGSLLPCRRS